MGDMLRLESRLCAEKGANVMAGGCWGLVVGDSTMGMELWLNACVNNVIGLTIWYCCVGSVVKAVLEMVGDWVEKVDVKVIGDGMGGKDEQFWLPIWIENKVGWVCVGAGYGYAEEGKRVGWLKSGHGDVVTVMRGGEEELLLVMMMVSLHFNFCNFAFEKFSFLMIHKLYFPFPQNPPITKVMSSKTTTITTR